MADSVKFIFKSLIKVPIIIMVTYAIFNLFAFSFTYFKLVGFSYVVLQTAAENNYIPGQEKVTLTNYAQSMETGVVDNIKIGCDTNPSNNSGTNGPYIDIKAADSDNNRVQYGNEITVTVSGHYRFIWPLMPNEQKQGNKAVQGMESTPTGANLTEDELQAARDAYADNTVNNIVIQYTIPGLQYYPDLSN